MLNAFKCLYVGNILNTLATLSLYCAEFKHQWQDR